MKITIHKEPCYLYEALQAAFYFTNHISHETTRSALMKHYAMRSDADKAAMNRRVDYAAAILEEAVKGIDPDDPRLDFYFKKFETNSQNELCCLAKVLVLSFCNATISDFDEQVRYTRSIKHEFFSHDFYVDCFSPIGLSLFTESRTEPPHDTLLHQLDAMDYPFEYKWKTYAAFEDFDKHMDELASILRPVADRIKAAVERKRAVFDEACAHWEKYFKEHTLDEHLKSLYNMDTHDWFSDETVVSIAIIACREGIEATGEGAPYYEKMQLYIGIAATDGIRMNSPAISEDKFVCSVMKALSDKNRYEIFKGLSREKNYLVKISEDMNLNRGNVARMLNSFYSLELVSMEQVDNRIYYTANRQMVESFINSLRDALLHD